MNTCLNLLHYLFALSFTGVRGRARVQGELGGSGEGSPTGGESASPKSESPDREDLAGRMSKMQMVRNVL